jgi:Rrf2 family iron-sulfur cluster assembly transcriptional regulator
MRMSTKGRLAVNALIDLALRERVGPVALLSVSDRQRVSLSYLEQMFSRLRRSGIVEATRGPGGGYSLGRPAAQISVADIVSAVDEPEDAEPRTGLADGLSTQLWRDVQAVMLAHMATISLQSLLDQQIAQGAQIERLPGAQPTKATAQAAAQGAARAAAASNVTRLPLRCKAPNSVFAFGQSFAA